jgi:probable HAF family extracellular repeat protein
MAIHRLRSTSAPTKFLKKLGTATATGAVLWTLQGGIARAASFQGLGYLPGGGFFYSNALGVSGDGSVVVGQSYSANGAEAFRWTTSGGMVGLGFLPGGESSSQANGVSGDGSVVVGYSDFANGAEAFRWTTSGGMVGLGFLPGGFYNSSPAYGVSGDGSVVVGISTSISTSYFEAFRWTTSGGMVGLGFLPSSGDPYNNRSGALGVSGDGSVVVGYSGEQAFRWTTSEGMVGLGFLPGGNSSFARGVSGDGSVVVGNSGQQAFRWTTSGGMVGLGFLPGGFYSQANGVSDDGSVVVGYSNSANEGGAFRWTTSGGMRNLQDVLTTDFGLNLTGWELSEANGISADGLTIVGVGTNPSGHNEAWIARLGSTPPPQSVPEPSNIFGLGLLGLGLAATKMKGALSKKAKSPIDNPQETDS